jgi:uncharacterized protein
MKTIAIYHKDCTDGTGAAAVVLKKYPDALTYPLGHGYEAHELEPILSSAETGDRILFVDCAIGAKEFLTKGFPVTVIDHHAGINAEFSAIAHENKNLTYIFDNSKSGASLTWATLFPTEKEPELIKYIQDQDLWTWKFGNDTKDVNNAIFTYANKPEEIVKLFDVSLDVLKKEGSIISRYNDYMIDHMVKTTEPLTLRLGEWKVPMYNITVHKSEGGNQLSKLRDAAVGLFSIDGDKVKISFRSIDGQKPDALDVAKALGGGGHRNSSGAAMNLVTFLKSIES